MCIQIMNTYYITLYKHAPLENQTENQEAMQSDIIAWNNS